MPEQGWGGSRSPKAMGTGCQAGELPPRQHPPSPGFIAPQPPPHGSLPALLCPREGPVLKQACFTRKFNVI